MNIQQLTEAIKHLQGQHDQASHGRGAYGKARTAGVGYTERPAETMTVGDVELDVYARNLTLEDAKRFVALERDKLHVPNMRVMKGPKGKFLAVGLPYQRMAFTEDPRPATYEFLYKAGDSVRVAHFGFSREQDARSKMLAPYMGVWSSLQVRKAHDINVEKLGDQYFVTSNYGPEKLVDWNDK